MNILSTTSAGKISGAAHAQARLGSPKSNKSTFDGMLGKVQRTADPSNPEKIREVAEKYVAGSMVLPMLKQAREARDSTPPFGMTDAEKQLGSLMDSQLANDMVKRGNWALVDRITSRLMEAGKKSAAQPVAPATPPAGVAS